ncbi:MAG: LamG-like jellyroll fold domain-containing protein, partial [Candidatus Levyibacteriota bacterium]
YHIIATFSTTHAMSLYVNGVLDTTNANTARGGSPFSTKLAIGSGYNGGVNAFFFNGIIDEARVSNTDRSADWIATEYANQNNPGSFVTLSTSEETKIYAAPLSALMRHGKFFDTSSNNYGKQPFLF